MSGPGYRVAHLEEIPAVPAAGGLEWRGIRSALGVQAFGINAYSSSAAGQDVVEDHDETGAGAGRHEELYIVISGHAEFTVGGEEVDAPVGTLVFVSDPTVRRHAVATAPGTTVLALGGTAGEPYRPGPWEWSFRAEPLARAGEHAKAQAIMQEGLQLYPDNPAMLYNAACFTALAGDADTAVEYLRRAFAADPGKVRPWAASDSDLDSLRDRPDYPVT
jgi:tetratricopeptide (TPR) repeat protein